MLCKLCFLHLLLISLIIAQDIKVSIDAKLTTSTNTTSLPKKIFPNQVLAYLTPWNKKGFENSIKYAPKLTMVSPVWFQIKYYTTIGYRVEGVPDKNWIQEMRKRCKETGSSVKILPRFSLTDWSQQAYQIFLSNKEAVEKVANSILHVVKLIDLDGIVFEYGYLPMPMVYDQMKLFLTKLSTELKSSKKELVLVIPAPKQQDKILFENKYIAMFESVVDYFSLMTYDFAHPGPLSPLDWVRSCVQYYASSKVLMGINFYGYRDKDAIIGDEYLKLLKEKPVKKWHKGDAEEYFKTKKGETVYYPTKRSMKERISLAKKNGVGIAIWELGQGLDEFFDLF